MSTYRAVLAVPTAGRTFAAALVGRLSFGVVGLALTLALTAATRSYALAGGAIALFGLTSSLLSPARARLIDRFGVRRTIPPMTTAYAGCVLLIAVFTWHPGAPVALLWVLVGLGGSLTPPLGPVMRAMWSGLIDEPAMRLRAYSLDSVAEELLFVLGPLIAGALTAIANPSLGLIVSAGLVMIGAIGMAISPAAFPGSARPAAGERGQSSAWKGLVRLRQPVIATASVGMCLGATGLLVVVFARGHGWPAAAAWIEAAMSVGSVVGGVVYGATQWRASLERRLVVLTIALTLSVVAAAFAPNVGLLAVLLGVAGLFLSPTLATSNLLADRHAAPGGHTQAGAWVNTAFNTGNAAGSAAIGLVVGPVTVLACFLVSAAAPALGALGALRPPSRTRRQEQ